jgi:hypothetical protein
MHHTMNEISLSVMRLRHRQIGRDDTCVHLMLFILHLFISDIIVDKFMEPVTNMDSALSASQIILKYEQYFPIEIK